MNHPSGRRKPRDPLFLRHFRLVVTLVAGLTLALSLSLFFCFERLSRQNVYENATATLSQSAAFTEDLLDICTQITFQIQKDNTISPILMQSSPTNGETMVALDQLAHYQYIIQSLRSIYIVNTRTGQTTGTANTAPVVRDGQTFVAIRPVAEQFGFDVLWDQSSQTVRIVNGLASDWSYAWTVTQDGSGGLLVGVHSPVNLVDAAITGVTVKSTTSPSSSDGSRFIRPTTAQELAALQTAAGTTLLDAVRVDYPFAAGESYTITVSLQVTKTNGASSSASGSFQINLPAPGETAGSNTAAAS